MSDSETPKATQPGQSSPTEATQPPEAAEVGQKAPPVAVRQSSRSSAKAKAKLVEIASDWAENDEDAADAAVLGEPAQEAEPEEAEQSGGKASKANGKQTDETSEKESNEASENQSEDGTVKENGQSEVTEVSNAVKAPVSPGKSAKKSKKESFKWNTPADEFADDVGSDEEGEYYDDPEESTDIVIHLGQDADKYELEKKFQIKSENPEDIKRFVEHYKASLKDKEQRNAPKKPESKQKYECPKCSKVWNWPWELRRHVLTHYKEKERQQTTNYRCEECGRGFQWKRDLAQHRRLHTGDKLLVCSVCEKKFTTRQALLHHVVVHTGEKPFQCALCGNRFTQPANLRTHMKKKHGGGGIDANKCPHCQEQFQSIIAVHQHILEDHQNIVAEDREEQQMEKLKKEQEKAEKLRQKEERRKLRAERKKEKIDFNDFRSRGLQEWEINYEFYIGEGLVRGVDWDRTPSNGELACEICERKFGWRYEVMFHNLCHMVDEFGNTKNRLCPECDTSFKVPIGLKHHLLLHTGELPFLCLHCWRSFSSHIDLKLHIRKEHLFHLEPEKKDNSSNRKMKIKTEPKRLTSIKGQKMEVDPSTDEQETMELVMANQMDEHGEGQTILLGSDGTIVHTGDQDMIVVIQSEDFDQNNGLIVVDPSQLQQVMGSDGMPVTVLQTQDGMIFGQDGSKVMVSEAGSSMALQMSNDGDVNSSTTTTTTTYAVQGADGKFFLPDGTQVEAANISIKGEDEGQQILVSQTNDSGSGEEETTHIIVSDAASTTEADSAADESIAEESMNNQSATRMDEDGSQEEGEATTMVLVEEEEQSQTAA